MGRLPSQAAIRSGPLVINGVGLCAALLVAGKFENKNPTGRLNAEKNSMPTYDYECDACGHEFELFQSISEAVQKKCPECGKNKLRRLIGAGAAIMCPLVLVWRCGAKPFAVQRSIVGAWVWPTFYSWTACPAVPTHRRYRFLWLLGGCGCLCCCLRM